MACSFIIIVIIIILCPYGILEGNLTDVQHQAKSFSLTGFLCSICEVFSYRVREPVNQCHTQESQLLLR